MSRAFDIETRRLLRRSASFLLEQSRALRDSTTVGGRWPADATTEHDEYVELRHLVFELNRLARKEAA